MKDRHKINTLEDQKKIMIFYNILFISAFNLVFLLSERKHKTLNDNWLAEEVILSFNKLEPYQLLLFFHGGVTSKFKKEKKSFKIKHVVSSCI